MNKKILCLALGAAFVTGTAQADLLQSNSGTDPKSTTDINKTITLQKFDDGGGTMELHGASLLITSDWMSSTVLTNNAANSQFFSYQADLLFFLTEDSGAFGGLPPTVTETIATTGGFITMLPGDVLDLTPGGVSGQVEASDFRYDTPEIGDHSVAGPHDGVFSIAHTNETYSLVTLDAAALALVTGPGTFDVNCSTLTSSSFTGGGGNIALQQATSAGCSAEVVYHYDNVTVVPPMPEPTVLALLGLSIAGLGFSRRKAK